MAIITISRGTLSGGRRLAQCVGLNLGYAVVSREELEREAAARYGIDEQRLRRGLEQGPTLWDRFRVDRRLYLAVAKATLCHLVRDDRVVYHGHAGHLLLREIGHVLRVRTIVPMAHRIPYAIAEHGLDEETAESYILKKDEERRSWTRFLYGIEWGDPVLYDLTLNLERFTIESACALLATVVERPEFAATPENRRALEDLRVASDAHARLFLNPRVAASAAGIEVRARDGVLELSGLLHGEGLRDEIIGTCQALPEVREVQAEWLAGRVEPV
jgi:cytidylate kinase